MFSVKDRLAPAGLTLLLLVGPVLAHAGDDAAAWLDRMAASGSSISYQGVVAFTRGGDQLDSLRITHGRAGGQLYERLEYLDDAQREVVLEGDQLVSSTGDRQLVRSLSSRQLVAVDAERIGANYDASMTGVGRVAERPTVELTLSPRDTHRLGYRLSLDRESGLLLRSEVIDPDRGVLERFQFSVIDISTHLKDEWVAGARVASAVVDGEGEGAEQSQGPDWQPAWLPSGFEATVEVRGERQMRTYSDGLAVLSVVVQPQDGAESLIGKAQRGATVAFTRGTALDGRNYAVTVIGEVPLATAQRVAESVAPVTATASPSA